ncbi:MAG: glycine--tRNA ligase [Candidatus Portnoybacteria bacterium RBG_13_40_8]|uniref:Glycine--tRNA ligase n=1 Tax=Candidatus Portnoybacteria bacterium RBG_13_40_8 TaxID=1801990 RepID=A0A1G2F486_9BACT|nr:MAG: glycine--tRNA ligase [Candidatus Portnoybacteria bacterium RBG_13_40_8]
MENLIEKIVSLCKRRGFIYPGSDIYGGLANTFDFGPLGVELANNIKKSWWKKFVQDRDDMYGLDGGILMNPKIWEASGHTAGFIDVLVECKKCHKRFRADQIDSKKCPECGGELTEPKKFVPMFKTFIGPVEDSSSVAYLRPETAQAIFVNFKNIIDSFHPEIPFGIAQMGKAFRNEITLGNFIFRKLEFEQMEIEYFIQGKDWEKYFELWKKEMEGWFLGLGIKKKSVRWREHKKDELSHYSKHTEDLEYNFPFGGFKELYGLAYRTDYDLKNHSDKSGKDLRYIDLKTNERFFPYVIEPSFGLERTMLAVLSEAYDEEEIKGIKRVVLKFKPSLAPIKVAVFPLLANKPDLIKKARQVYEIIRPYFLAIWDDRGNIGKRYYAQDEAGTPFCVTIDFDTLEKDDVTVRYRDSMKQERVKIDELTDYLKEKLNE